MLTMFILHSNYVLEVLPSLLYRYVSKTNSVFGKASETGLFKKSTVTPLPFCQLYFSIQTASFGIAVFLS